MYKPPQNLEAHCYDKDDFVDPNGALLLQWGASCGMGLEKTFWCTLI